MRINTYKHQIEAATYEVFHQLGRGLNKAIYHKAFTDALISKGLAVTTGKIFKIKCADIFVGDYIADVCINENIVIQVMAAIELKAIEETKLTNHLTMMKLEFGYLINFGQTAEVKGKFRMDRLI
jgi:GxxExxY protein